MMPWLGSMFILVHNYSLTPEFATSFCPSYLLAQKASLAPRLSATRHVIHINGLASNSSIFIRAKGAQTVMPQFFPPFNTKEELTLLARGED